eukprot:6206794-Pleurochrysis_carterae.AAC.1
MGLMIAGPVASCSLRQAAVLRSRAGLLSASMSAGAMTPPPQRVALVTGASRGIGKGIAVALGRAGFIVYAVGRSSRESSEETGLDLTIEATAENITSVGGTGHALRCDISKDEAINEAIAQVSDAEGRLDLLCCSAYTVPSGPLKAPFWEQGVEMWDAVNSVGLRSVYLTCCAAAQLMISTAAKKDQASPPLMVLVSSFGGKAYTFNVAYGVGKAAVDRLAADMSQELGALGVATCALYPGVVKTENNLALEAAGKWKEASGGLDLSQGETPDFSGKGVAALASLTSEEIFRRSGSVQVVAELAREFGFTEEDGRQPPSIRSTSFLLPNYAFPEMEKQGMQIPQWVKDNVPDVLLPWSIFSAGPAPKREGD